MPSLLPSCPNRDRLTFRCGAAGTTLTVANYLAVAGGGYATYGSNVTGDLLISYPRSAVIARVALVFVVLQHHPVSQYPPDGRLDGRGQVPVQSRVCAVRVISGVVHAVVRPRVGRQLGERGRRDVAHMQTRRHLIPELERDVANGRREVGGECLPPGHRQVPEPSALR